MLLPYIMQIEIIFADRILQSFYFILFYFQKKIGYFFARQRTHIKLET